MKELVINHHHFGHEDDEGEGIVLALALDPFDQELQIVLKHCLVHCLAVREIAIERAAGHSGALGD